MSKVRKLVSAFSLLFAFIALNGIVAAQEEAPKQKTEAQKKERTQRNMRKQGMERKHFSRSFRGGHGGQSMIRGLGRLELDEAQKSQIKNLMETQRAAQKPQMEEIHSLMLKKRDGSFTDADSARMDSIKQEMKASNDQVRASVLGVLTPEQHEKLNQMKVEGEKRMEQRKLRMDERKERFRERKSQAPPAKKDN